MLQKIGISAVILFSSSISLAQIDRQILKQIEQTNRPPPPPTAPVFYGCTDCSLEAETHGLARSCVKQICDDKGLLPAGQYPKLEPQELAQPSGGEKEIEELINQINAKSAAMDTNQPKFRAMVSGGKWKMDHDSLNFVMQNLAVSAAYKSYDWDGTSFKFNQSKFDKLSINLSKKNREAINTLAKGMVNGTLGTMESLSKLKSANVDVYLSAYYPGKSKGESVQQLVKDFETSFEGMKKTGFGQMISKILDINTFASNPLVKDVKSGKDVTELAIKELIADKISMETLTIFYSSDTYPLMEILVDYGDLKKKLSSSENLTAMIASMDKGQGDGKRKREDRLAQCLSTYRHNFLILPSKQQIEALKEEINKTKQALKTKWLPLYSSETQKKLNKYLDETEFLLPMERSEYVSAVKDRFRRELAEAETNAKLKIRNLDTLVTYTSSMAFAKTIRDPSQPVEADSDSSDENDCSKDHFETLNDGNYTLFGKIQTSYTTARAHFQSSGVVAHELGHGIYKLFADKQASSHSTKTQKSFTDCLVSQHEKDGQKYENDDFADFVSAHVSNTNFACLLVDEWPLGAKLMADDPNDGHSSDFARILQIESIQRKTLPDQCNSFLVAQKTPRDFLKCEHLVK